MTPGTEVLWRLKRLQELVDPSIGAHLDRVAELSARLALAVELDATQVEAIRLAAPLHDIGKLALPKELLTKPGRLTSIEFAQVKTHTELGFQMLDSSAHAVVRTAAEIALSHHERWDGHGYPHRLVREEIPLAARVVSIADVYDALTTRRPYKHAWAHDEAIDHMSRDRGRAFDPALLDAFLRVCPAPRKDVGTEAERSYL